jgi:hypothetical protein
VSTPGDRASPSPGPGSPDGEASDSATWPSAVTQGLVDAANARPVAGAEARATGRWPWSWTVGPGWRGWLARPLRRVGALPASTWRTPNTYLTAGAGRGPPPQLLRDPGQPAGGVSKVTRRRPRQTTPCHRPSAPGIRHADDSQPVRRREPSHEPPDHLRAGPCAPPDADGRARASVAVTRSAVEDPAEMQRALAASVSHISLTHREPATRQGGSAKSGMWGSTCGDGSQRSGSGPRACSVAPCQQGHGSPPSQVSAAW